MEVLELQEQTHQDLVLVHPEHLDKLEHLVLVVQTLRDLVLVHQEHLV